MKQEGLNGVGIRGQDRGGITLKNFEKSNENPLLSMFPKVYMYTNIWKELSYNEEVIPLADKSRLANSLNNRRRLLLLELLVPSTLKHYTVLPLPSRT